MSEVVKFGLREFRYWENPPLLYSECSRALMHGGLPGLFLRESLGFYFTESIASPLVGQLVTTQRVPWLQLGTCAAADKINFRASYEGWIILKDANSLVGCLE